MASLENIENRKFNSSRESKHDFSVVSTLVAVIFILYGVTHDFISLLSWIR